jgi:hypothetical protein
MVVTVEEYAKMFPSKGKEVSPKTIIRRCINGFLPSHHKARKLPGGDWVIEIADETSPEIVVTKTNPPKPDIRTMNRKYFSFG